MSLLEKNKERLRAVGIEVSDKKPKSDRTMSEYTDAELTSIALNPSGPTPETQERALTLLEERHGTPA